MESLVPQKEGLKLTSKFESESDSGSPKNNEMFNGKKRKNVKKMFTDKGREVAQSNGESEGEYYDEEEEEQEGGDSDEGSKSD